MKIFTILFLALTTKILYASSINTYSIGFTMNKKGESYIVESLNIELSQDNNYFIRKIPKRNINNINFIEEKVSIISSQKQDKSYEGRKIDYSFSSDDKYNYYLFHLDNELKNIDLTFIYKTNYNLLTEKNDEYYSATITLLEPNSWQMKREGKYQSMLLRDIKVSFIDKIQNEPKINNLRGVLKNKITLKIDYLKTLMDLDFISKMKLDYPNWINYLYSLIFTFFMGLIYYYRRKRK